MKKDNLFNNIIDLQIVFGKCEFKLENPIVQDALLKFMEKYKLDYQHAVKIIRNQLTINQINALFKGTKHQIETSDLL